MSLSFPDEQPCARSKGITLKEVYQAWLPLAASWLLMAIELPIISAVVARSENPEINLAALGGIVFPIALVIEAPIMMLLAASTTLATTRQAYQRLKLFAHLCGIVLTIIHLSIVLTPLYGIVVENALGVPKETLPLGKTGLALIAPWAWAIAIRRFHQGVLIRFGRSRAVGIGTLVRLIADAICIVLTTLYWELPGIAVAGLTLTTGVLAEALFINYCAAPIEKSLSKGDKPHESELEWSKLLNFYWPLALGPLANMLSLPLVSAAMSRMPSPLESLAAWPVLSGFIFMFRSTGFAYNEVVIALLSKPKGREQLKRFTKRISIIASVFYLLTILTPLANLWFHQVSGLADSLAKIALVGAVIGIPLPALSFVQSWYRGQLVAAHHTVAVSQAVAVFLIGISAILAWGVSSNTFTGLYIGISSLGFGGIIQTLWLYHKTKKLD